MSDSVRTDITADWEAAASRPSKTNCTTGRRDGLPAGESSWQGYWWKEKNALVDQFLEEWPDRAIRPVSVRGDVTLREEATTEKREDEDGHRRARPWHAVLNEFLLWYNDYRHAHLLFKDPEGNRVRAQMPNAHQPSYGRKYYARLKALERQMVRRYDDLHVVMLTLTGSMRNANGGWRCPCDHMRDVVSSWRPDRGRGVYHALYDALSGYEWEYALVVEKHKNGYGHVHVAVFVDGAVTAEDFHPAIDAHLRHCEIAHRDAHDYYAPEEEARPISIRRVDTDLDPDDYDDYEDRVGNVGSYIGEYIGAFGGELFDRGLDELVFRAAAWATGTQVIRFSTGANEMINHDLDRDDDEPAEPEVRANPEFDPEEHATPENDVKPYEVVEGTWSIEAIGRVDETGEDLYDVTRSGVSWKTIDDASYLDPPSVQSDALPEPQRRQATFGK